MSNKTVWTPIEKAAWRLPKTVTVSDWSDANRVIAGNDVSEPGPWRTSRAPYLRGPMDAFSDPAVRIIDIMGPAQCGKSEVITNMEGWSIDTQPGPILHVIARDEDCSYVSNERLLPSFKASAAIARHISDKPWDMKKGSQFSFDLCSLYFTGAQSIAGLASKSIKYLFLDERDKMPTSIGNEGSPADFAMARTQTFWDSKIVSVCTPTVPEGAINRSYKRSNMCVYPVPCPRCGEYIRLNFEQLKVEPADLRDPDAIRESKGVYYQCQICGGRIEEHEKTQAAEAGTWLAAGLEIVKSEKFKAKSEEFKTQKIETQSTQGAQRNTEKSEKEELKVINKELKNSADFAISAVNKIPVIAADGDSWEHNGNVYSVEGKCRSMRHCGFWIDGPLSPFPGVSWIELMALWFERIAEKEINPKGMQEFVNQKLGRVWQDKAKTIEPETLRHLCNGYAAGVVPADVIALTAGADYHIDQRNMVRLDWEVLGWASDGRNYVIATGAASSFEELDRVIIQQPWQWEDPKDTRPPLPVVQMFVDSGYKPDDVYKYCRTRWPLVMPTKGASGKQIQPLRGSDLEKIALNNRNAKATKYRGMQLVMVDEQHFKDQVHGWLETLADDNGEVVKMPMTSFYSSIPDYYFRELCNEHKVRERGGTYRWETVTPSAATHSLDIHVLAAAAGWQKRIHYFTRQQMPESAAAKVYNSRVARPTRNRDGFLNDLPSL